MARRVILFLVVLTLVSCGNGDDGYRRFSASPMVQGRLTRHIMGPVLKAPQLRRLQEVRYLLADTAWIEVEQVGARFRVIPDSSLRFYFHGARYTFDLTYEGFEYRGETYLLNPRDPVIGEYRGMINQIRPACRIPPCRRTPYWPPLINGRDADLRYDLPGGDPRIDVSMRHDAELGEVLDVTVRNLPFEYFGGAPVEMRFVSSSQAQALAAADRD